MSLDALLRTDYLVWFDDGDEDYVCQLANHYDDEAFSHDRLYDDEGVTECWGPLYSALHQKCETNYRNKTAQPRT